jgi:type II secretory pathway pseudopilin PulG
MIILAVLAAIAVPAVVSQREKARDTAVRTDLGKLGREIATQFMDATAAPTVAVVAGRYAVAGQDAGAQTPGVLLVTNYAAPLTTGASVTTTSWTSTAWCIALHDPQGSVGTFKFSAQNGLESGQCASATSP